MAKPSPTQLLALRGLRDQFALGGKHADAKSPFWGPLRGRKWLSDDGWLTPEGVEVADRYRAILLTCRHCQSPIASYVAERGVTKELGRVCRVCGSERQTFVVDGTGFEAVGLTVNQSIRRLFPGRG